MTVQELIDELKDFDDPDMEVKAFGNELTDIVFSVSNEEYEDLENEECINLT